MYIPIGYLAFVLLVVLSIVACLFALSYFLGTQLLKKFSIFKKHTRREDSVTRLACQGLREAGMVVIKLTSLHPFSALVCVELTWPTFLFGGAGVDPYGCVEGVFNPEKTLYEAYFSTYLGQNDAYFVFLVNSIGTAEAELVATKPEDVAKLPVQATFAPHQYQRMGFYA